MSDTLRQQAIQKILGYDGDLTEENITAASYDLHIVPDGSGRDFRESAIVQLLDDGDDVNEESVAAIVKTLHDKFDVTIGIVPTQSSLPMDERIVSPTKSQGRDALIVADREPDQIQKGGHTDLSDIEIEATRDAEGYIVQVLTTPKYDIIETEMDTPERRESRQRAHGNIHASQIAMPNRRWTFKWDKEAGKLSDVALDDLVPREEKED